MPKQDDRACEMQKPSEIGGTPLISGHESPRVLEPRKEALDLPAAPVPSKRPAVLGEVDPVAAVRGDQLDPAIGEHAVEPVAVIGGIADQALRVVGEKAGVQRLRDEPGFVRRGRGDGNGDRKTSAVCDCHDLGPLSPLGFSDVAPFFLVLAKEPSMNASLRSNPPRAWRSAASALRTRRSVPRWTQR